MYLIGIVLLFAVSAAVCDENHSVSRSQRPTCKFIRATNLCELSEPSRARLCNRLKHRVRQCCRATVCDDGHSVSRSRRPTCKFIRDANLCELSEPSRARLCNRLKHRVRQCCRATAPTCAPRCVTGQGECVVLQNSQLASHLEDKAYCNCSAANDGFYYGNQCQHKFTVICDPPCQNGGECDISDPGVCRCTTTSTGFWYGSDCSLFHEYICESPCLNGGTCWRSRCSCLDTEDGRYAGSSCESFTRYICNPPCINGLCSYNSCYCWGNSTVQYSGDSCEEEIFSHTDPCNPECENGGICNYGKCTCASNSTHYFSGSSCERVNECPCTNGGTCEDFGRCRCPLRYTGPTCETDLGDGCPCLNDGTCENNDTCRCRGNETHILHGTFCKSTTLRICYPTPLNGGSCLHGDYELTEYKCPYDDVGYFHGKQCLEYDYRNISCLAHRVYVNGRCRCPYSLSERFSYEGLDCERRIDE